MKLITKYFFMTLIIAQALFVFLWYIDFNLFGLVSWFGKGEELNFFKFFSPLLAFGAIKISYWIADPLSKLYIIILRWVLLIAIVYFVYWLFFIP